MIKSKQGVIQVKKISDEIKNQILNECIEVGNVALVARRYNISPNTIHSWRRKVAKSGTTEALPRAASARLKKLERRLENTATENITLKKIVAEKELELAILREMRDLANPK